MTLLVTTVSNVLPLFVLILLGAVLRRTSMIDQAFISSSSKLVFRIALPVMVFRRLSQVQGVPSELLIGIALFAVVTVVVVALLWLLLRRVDGEQIVGKAIDARNREIVMDGEISRKGSTDRGSRAHAGADGRDSSGQTHRWDKFELFRTCLCREADARLPEGVTEDIVS